MKKLFLLKKGSGMTFLPVNISKEILVKPKSQNWSGKRTALFIGNQLFQTATTRFRRLEGKNSRTLIGSRISNQDATKLGSNVAKKSQDFLLYIRAVQGHAVGKVVAPELMSHVAGERTLYERLSTPRPAPKIVLKSAWQSQQQQQQQDTSESSVSGSTRKLVREEDQGTLTDNPEPPSFWKQMRSTEPLVEKEEPEFKFDFRNEGIAQDVILEHEERMGQIRKVVDKLRTGYHTKSLIEDLGKT